MPSHIHLIFRSSLVDPSRLVRDFIGFTSIKIHNIIEKTLKKAEKNG